MNLFKLQIITISLLFMISLSPISRAQPVSSWEIGEVFTEDIQILIEWEMEEEDGISERHKSDREIMSQYRISGINQTAKLITVDYLSGGAVYNITYPYDGEIFGSNLATGLISGQFTRQENETYLIGLSTMTSPRVFVDFDGLGNGFEENFVKDKVILTYEYFAEPFNITLGDLLGSVTWSINDQTSMESVDINDSTRTFEIIVEGGTMIYRLVIADNGSSLYIPYDTYEVSSVFEYDESGRLLSIKNERNTHSQHNGVTETLEEKRFYKYTHGEDRTLIIVAIILGISGILVAIVVYYVRNNRVDKK